MLYSASDSVRTKVDGSFQIVKILHANLTTAMKYSIYLYIAWEIAWASWSDAVGFIRSTGSCSCPRSTFLPSIWVTCPDNIHAGLCGAAWKSDWGTPLYYCIILTSIAITATQKPSKQRYRPPRCSRPRTYRSGCGRSFPSTMWSMRSSTSKCCTCGWAAWSASRRCFCHWWTACGRRDTAE